MNPRSRIVFILLLFIIAMPGSAHALDGANVGGCCQSSGPIATPMGVNLAAQEAIAKVNAFTAAQSAIINANIKSTGEAITAEIAKNREATTKLFEDQNDTLHQYFNQFGSAQAELKNQERVGKYSRFDNLCFGPKIGAGVQVGKKAEKKMVQKLEDDSWTYNEYWRNPDELLAYQVAKDTSKINAEVLFPVNKTLNPDNLKYAQDMIELIVNPYPTINLPEYAKQTQAGKQYQVVQKQKNALLSIPQVVFNKALAAMSPTLPLGNVATELYQQMGNSGPPEQVVDGKISPYAFLSLISDIRFANPNWWGQLADRNPKGVLSESLAMDAARLEIQNRMLELTQLQTLMVAQQESSGTQEATAAALNQLYTNAAKN